MLEQGRSDKPTLLSLAPLPQLVPSGVCLSCDVCCRFPDRDSFLRPYFTGQEIARAVAEGVDPRHFGDPSGCQVEVVPNPLGDGYCCPAFDPATSRCRIYQARPLDCQIYPLAVMWDREERRVVLGWDTKCPFGPRGAGPEARGGERAGERAGPTGSRAEVDAYADRIAAQIEQADRLEVYAAHPRLIGRYQDDVLVLRELPRLTAALQQDRETRGAKRETGVGTSSSAINHRPSSIGSRLRPLTLDDRARVDEACAGIETPLSAFGFAPHFVWRGLFAFSWAELDGHLCLFAEYEDGVFMPLPPLPGARNGTRETRNDGERTTAAFANAEVVAECVRFMRGRNGGAAVSRIENIPEDWTSAFERWGYRLTPKDPEYLYRAADLAALPGDRYKSQRAACNRFLRRWPARYEPYRAGDREECLALYRRWAAQQEAGGPAAGDPVAQQMLKDAGSAHGEALEHADALGLAGRVVRVDGALVAYTFGFRRGRSISCVLLEIADRSLPGAAQFIFREFCREAAAAGDEFVNTLDDSGLPGLARSKQAYHPCRLVTGAIATEG